MSRKRTFDAFKVQGRVLPAGAVPSAHSESSKRLKSDDHSHVEGRLPESLLRGQQQAQGGNQTYTVPTAPQSDPAPRKQGASEDMKKFQRVHDTVLDYLLAYESDEQMGESCKCGEGTRTCLCYDCERFDPCCEKCFLAAEVHVNNPGHWVHHWDSEKGFLTKKDQSEIGRVLTFGHSRGQPVECQARGDKNIQFTLVDINGVHETRAYFCECPVSSGHDRFSQLLLSRVFPSTVSQPRVGFTFRLMQDYQLHCMISKESGTEYMEAIQRKTNNAFPQESKELYRQFLRAHRVYSWVLGEKRSGQGHNIDKYYPNRRAKSIVVPCFTCPERGFNISDNEMDTAPVRYVHTVQLEIMVDGHFGLPRIKKVDDPDDISLCDGAGFFPADSEYDPYLTEYVMTDEEKSTCSKFNAIEMQNKVKFKGCVITGVVAVECGRHCIFLSMVDLHKGERFSNTDFAVARALRWYIMSDLATLSLNAAKHFVRILLTYDVACQYYKRLKARFEKCFLDLAAIIDIIYALVPKMHLHGHIDDCKYKFNLNFFPGTGRAHGEGIETSWPHLKRSGAMTRNMNHGHRHDKLNDLQNFWNWKKVQGMAELTQRLLKKARQDLPIKVHEFLNMSRLFGKTKVEQWEHMEDVAWVELLKRDDITDAELKSWSSPYRLTLKKLPTQDEVLKQMESEEMLVRKQNGEKTTKNSKQDLVVNWVNRAMRCQEKQDDIKQAVKKWGDIDDVEKMRVALTKEIKALRKLQVRALPELEDAISKVEDQGSAIEKEMLFLPSDLIRHSVQKDYDLALHSHPDPAVVETFRMHCNTEFRLRRGQANESVELLCSVILHAMILRDYKENHVTGVKMNLRSMKYINTVVDKKNKYARMYRDARHRVLSLSGGSAEIEGEFPKLELSDTYAKNAAKTPGLGDGSVNESWIWTYGGLKALKPEERSDFLDEVKRVRWFRARAAMNRGIEEVEALEAQFRHFIQGCEHTAQVWRKLADEPSPFKLSAALKGSPTKRNAGYVVYAMRKSAMYQKMADNARSRFMECGGWSAEKEKVITAEDDDELGDGEDSFKLWAFLDSRRPNLDYDWNGKGGLSDNVAKKEMKELEQQIMRKFHAPFTVEDAEEQAKED